MTAWHKAKSEALLDGIGSGTTPRSYVRGSDDSESHSSAGICHDSHVRLLDLPFTAQPNADEHTLFIRQRNVKTPWTVSLNGRKLGALETLAQPLVLALPIPPGVLRDGGNRLTIIRGPSRMLDDIVVGGITLAPQPRTLALTQARVQVAVTATETGRALPCRLTLVDAQAALQPLHVDDGQRLAVRTGVIYTSKLHAARVRQFRPHQRRTAWWPAL